MQLGDEMYFQGLVLRGALDARGWRRFLATCATDLGMTPAGEPATWTYPTDEGAGGSGLTIVQPITESFLALDTWSDRGGAYLFICSCKRFEPGALDAAIDGAGLVRMSKSEMTRMALS